MKNRVALRCPSTVIRRGCLGSVPKACPSVGVFLACNQLAHTYLPTDSSYRIRVEVSHPSHRPSRTSMPLKFPILSLLMIAPTRRISKACYLYPSRERERFEIFPVAKPTLTADPVTSPGNSKKRKKGRFCWSLAYDLGVGYEEARAVTVELRTTEAGLRPGRGHCCVSIVSWIACC